MLYYIRVNENNSQFDSKESIMKYVMGKRELILKILSDNPGVTYTPDEICDAILTDGKGRSTVYRIISLLVADGSLRRISDGRTRHCVYQYVGSADHIGGIVPYVHVYPCGCTGPDGYTVRQRH